MSQNAGSVARPVTVKHVAAAAGVSTATVSRVLSGFVNVRPSTADSVRAAMASLGYEPNHMAQSLRTQRTSSIGIVLPGFTNQFFFELIAQAVDIAKSAGYTILVGGDENPEPAALRFASRRLVDGLVYVAATGRLAAPTAIGSLSIPIVAFDRVPEQLELPVVQVDNRLGARVVTEHLISTGAKRIAHIGGPSHLTVSQMRRTTYLQTVAAAGLPTGPELMVEGDFSEGSGAAAMSQLLALPERPDAVFAANDLMAIGAMGYVHEHGLRVPDDVKIAGFDGLTAARFASPGLTTYAQPIPQMARVCVTRLIELIEGSVAATFGEAPMLFEGALVIRDSTSTAHGKGQ